MQKRGIWFIAAGVILVFIIAAIFFNNGPSPSDVLTSQNDSESEQIFCTADVKICDDGTAVSRTPPKCEFQACPIDTTLPPIPPMPGTIAEQKIDIQNFAFSPSTITIQAGTKITWTNLDSIKHTATSTSSPESFDSGLLEKGETYSFTFTKPGKYLYHCTPHPSMTGEIIVE